MRRLFATIAVVSAIQVAAQLNGNGLLIGATAEVGSSQKEGLFSWTNSESVKTVINREFGLVQTTSYPTWDTWSGTSLQDVGFNMDNANKVINWSKDNNKKVAIHLLTGSPTYFPAWLNSGTWDAASLDTLLNHWISFAITSNENATKVDYWNVVNEAFMWNGKYWNNTGTKDVNPWQQMGWEDDQSGLTGDQKVYPQHPVYIRRAFQMARQYTKAKLELRDYGIEFWNGSVKTRAFYQLVKHLLNTGIPIDAVGFQGHFRTDQKYDWDKLREAVAQYRALGLEVYLTEVDIGDADPVAAATTAHRTTAWDSTQSAYYHDMAQAAVKGGINWICLWGVGDNTNTYWRMGQSALLFDEQYQTKSAYTMFVQGLKDGLASGSAISPRSSARDNAQIRLNGNQIQVNGISDGILDIRDTHGSVVGLVWIKDGLGELPALRSGLYFLSRAGNRSQSDSFVIN